MPGRRRISINDSLCRRCQAVEPAITVRNEPLCVDCFNKYVATKVVKRMESFRVKNSEQGKDRYLLLPLSFGFCSTALLHLLNQHLAGQVQRTGRTGFRLQVLHVITDGDDPESVRELVEKVEERYPQHAISTCTLTEALALDGVQELLARHGLSLNSDAHMSSPAEQLQTLMSGFPSPTSRRDVSDLLRRRLIIHFAQSHNCEAILWADSTTRLAERTLAETAKGRGSSVLSLVADGDAIHGVPFYYPMRDLLSKEIAAFATFVEPPLEGLMLKDEARPAVSTKNTTIDDLMRQYFESVELEYPSIVTNVVKTAGKLRHLTPEEVKGHCELCDAPLEGHAPERSRLCYGCIRTLPQAVEG